VRDRKEDLQDLTVGHLRGVVDDLDGLGMAAVAIADG
jgi:hypothetical protein